MLGLGWVEAKEKKGQTVSDLLLSVAVCCLRAFISETSLKEHLWDKDPTLNSFYQAPEAQWMLQKGSEAIFSSFCRCALELRGVEQRSSCRDLPDLVGHYTFPGGSSVSRENWEMEGQNRFRAPFLFHPHTLRQLLNKSHQGNTWLRERRVGFAQPSERTHKHKWKPNK